MATPNALIPSQVLKSHPKLTETNASSTMASSSTTTDQVNEPSSSASSRSRRRKRHRKKASYSSKMSSEERSSSGAKSIPSSKQNANGIDKQHELEQRSSSQNYVPVLQQTGDLPDIYWRSIPVEHLRVHPNFVPLPEKVSRLDSLEDARNFRQGSWQWDALHIGRCTTSQAAGALGFLEPHAGKVLGVPLSWTKGNSNRGMVAYHRLRSRAIRTLEEMNEQLCESNDDDDDDDGGDEVVLNAKESKKVESVWASIVNRPFPFAAKYLVQMTPEEEAKRRRYAQRFNQSASAYSIRMYWGDAQESTAILTALNYFHKQDPGIVVKEVGMCGAGLFYNSTTENGLLVGASPDGVICYPDGTMEALEVKNHCPFAVNSMSSDRFRVRCMGFDPDSNSGVMPQYVPQLMMEIMCLGPSCTSAVMVRQTALNGAILVRIRRDDEWIDEMMYWLQRFYDDFVAKKKPPPRNFFFQGDKESTRYRKFLEWTKKLESQVELVHRLPNLEVQRVTGVNRIFLD